MRISFPFFTLAGLAGAANTFGYWHPPVQGDVRSPCPALSSLANHNIIPHNGKSLSVPLLVNAMVISLNFGEDLATFLALAGLKTSSNPASTIFNLDDLNKHSLIEHDASLSRADFNLGGDSHTFSQEIFDETLSYFGALEEISIADAGAARWGRVLTEQKRDPKFNYTAQARFLSYAESAVYFRVLNNPKTGRTPVDFIKILFEQERFPAKEGWVTPASPIGSFTVAADILALALATSEKSGTSFNETDFHGYKV
ncbi:Cloroperoxidase [Lindgomyces ingoldianus]|uniref:Cloroperoxidase n=1 Tax=Lindgomyces ingoldianus TaxID=673940 RepID=A0ACB6RDS9_9PLEO|nr:Cloroperoxidase [Lindgomyces ingoldianus]KAF2476480.1 Cloroperoxidase [Lindgomyces ingoldianus]